MTLQLENIFKFLANETNYFVVRTTKKALISFLKTEWENEKYALKLNICTLLMRRDAIFSQVWTGSLSQLDFLMICISHKKRQIL